MENRCAFPSAAWRSVGTVQHVLSEPGCWTRQHDRTHLQQIFYRVHRRAAPPERLPSVHTCLLICAPHSSFLKAKHCCPMHDCVPRGFVQVKFYRVDIDREEIADSVAEACVSTVVRSQPREAPALP